MIKRQPEADDFTSVRPKVNDQFDASSLSCVSAACMENVPVSVQLSERRDSEIDPAVLITFVTGGILPSIKEARTYW